MKKLIYLIVMVVFASCTPRPVKTIENLKVAIKGEVTASYRYAAFADKAREEGHDTIAKLFDALSKAEHFHATAHQEVLETIDGKPEDFKPEFVVKSTLENLQIAINSEMNEFANVYPAYIKIAEKEKAGTAFRSFTWALDTEKLHQELCKKALIALQAKKEFTLYFDYYVCPVCGNIYEDGHTDEECSFCDARNELFFKI